MFCKASVLKCPGLKKKGSLHCLLAESYLFRTMEILKSTLCAPPSPALAPTPPPPQKDNVACWLKLEQSALKH